MPAEMVLFPSMLTAPPAVRPTTSVHRLPASEPATKPSFSRHTGKKPGTWYPTRPHAHHDVISWPPPSTHCAASPSVALKASPFPSPVIIALSGAIQSSSARPHTRFATRSLDNLKPRPFPPFSPFSPLSPATRLRTSPNRLLSSSASLTPSVNSPAFLAAAAAASASASAFASANSAAGNFYPSQDVEDRLSSCAQRWALLLLAEYTLGLAFLAQALPINMLAGLIGISQHGLVMRSQGEPRSEAKWTSSSSGGGGGGGGSSGGGDDGEPQRDYTVLLFVLVSVLGYFSIIAYDILQNGLYFNGQEVEIPLLLGWD